MPRGGARPGAGRPKKHPPPTVDGSATPPPPGGEPFDAETYLAAIVAGRERPDQLRIAAAKAVIAYQRRRERAPLTAVPPRQLAQINMTQHDAEQHAAWIARADAIRQRIRDRERK